MGLASEGKVYRGMVEKEIRMEDKGNESEGTYRKARIEMERHKEGKGGEWDNGERKGRTRGKVTGREGGEAKEY